MLRSCPGNRRHQVSKTVLGQGEIHKYAFLDKCLVGGVVVCAGLLNREGMLIKVTGRLLETGGEQNDGDKTHRQSTSVGCGGGAGHPAPICSDQRTGVARSAVWMRAGPVWIVFGSDGWCGDTVVCHSGRKSGRQIDYHV